MEPRITTSELAYYVQREFKIDPYDFAFEFLLRWLRADPAIFLHENRILEEDIVARGKEERKNTEPDGLDQKAHRMDSRPDLFLTVDTPDGEPIRHDPGAMEAQEWVLKRRFLYDFLQKAGGTSDKLAAIYEEKYQECLSLFEYPRSELDFFTWDQDVYPRIADALKKDALSKEQWMVFHRVTMTQGLAIRYCLEVIGEVPVKVRRDFKRKYAVKAKTGLTTGNSSMTRDCADLLDALISSGLHEPRPRCAKEAAKQISEIWELELDVNSIYINIKEIYNEHLARK